MYLKIKYVNMYMDHIISDSLSFENLVKIVNSLALKINELEKKINVIQESNSVISDMSNEVILDEHIFRSLPINVPKVTRQNAFPPMNL
tara:strand:- start:12595 stop:12861 length:267 start_codon:yes stop_codon:yes gene_type:complete